MKPGGDEGEDGNGVLVWSGGLGPLCISTVYLNIYCLAFQTLEQDRFAASSDQR
jgi:hypothetical protein